MRTYVEHLDKFRDVQCQRVFKKYIGKEHNFSPKFSSVYWRVNRTGWAEKSRYVVDSSKSGATSDRPELKFVFAMGCGTESEHFSYYQNEFNALTHVAGWNPKYHPRNGRH